MEQTSLWAMLAQAGWTMIPLYVCSLLALAVILRTVIQYALHRVPRRRLLQDIGPDLVQGRFERIAELAEADRSPLGRTVSVAARMAQTPELAQAEAERVAW